MAITSSPPTIIPAGYITDAMISALGSLKILVERNTLTVAGTSFTFSGLDLNSHKHYTLYLELVNNTAVDADVKLEVNDDATATNYERQSFTYSNATASAGRVNDNTLGFMLASTPAFLVLDFQIDVDGNLRVTSRFSYAANNALILGISSVSHIATITNLTKIKIVTTQNMKIGSRASLFKN